MAHPYSAEEIFEIADEWWLRPSVRLLEASAATYRIFRNLMRDHQLGGTRSTDALIAAFALEHSAVLASNDSDFLRFPGLRLQNPLATKAGRGEGA